MAYSRSTTIADGVSDLVPVTFQYQDKSYVHVSLAGVQVPDAQLTWLSPTSIKLPSVPANGTVIRCYRTTRKDVRTTVFTSGPLPAKSLNDSAQQLLDAVQEIADDTSEALQVSQSVVTYLDQMATTYNLTLTAAGQAATSASNAAASAALAASFNPTDYYTKVAADGRYVALTQIGTTANKVVQLDANAKLPAVDGSQVTNVDAAKLGGKVTGSAAGNIPVLDAGAKVPVAAYQSGSVINSASQSTTANTTVSVAIPHDDTIPQNTEGTQVLTATITPLLSNSKLRARCSMVVGAGFDSCYAAAAMFIGSGVNAVQASSRYIANVQTNGVLAMEYEWASVGISPITVAIRIGAHAAAGLTLNGRNPSGGRLFGGAMASWLMIEEIAP